MNRILCSALLVLGFGGVAHAASLDVSDRAAYTSAHRALATALRDELRAGRNEAAVVADLAQHGREMPLREICASCEATASRVGDAYEPGVWLYQPAASASNARRAEPLIAFPPAGDDKAWTTVEALGSDGRWITLDAHKAPDVPVIVVRVNGRLSFEKQIAGANAMLRAAGLQRAGSTAGDAAPAAANGAKAGSGHWTTRLDMIRLNDDEEPWVSGSAEVYAITAGILPGNQAQVTIVDMPYLDNDGHTYYPRQVLLDWNDYSYGAANVLLYEHDDNTNYQELVGLIIQAIGQAGTLAGYSQAGAIAEIAGRIVAAMPSGWFSNDDDYVDSIYTIQKYETATRWGAAGNAQVTYVPYELPLNN